MRETQRQGKIRREEKLASAHSCCCFTLNWFYVLLTVQGWCSSIPSQCCAVSPRNFHALTRLVLLPERVHCNMSRRRWQGRMSPGGCARAAWTIFPWSVRKMFTLLFAVERFWILLKALPNQLPTCLLYVHILWLVLKHPALALQHMSFLQALMHLSSQINVREGKSYKLPWIEQIFWCASLKS